MAEAHRSPPRRPLGDAEMREVVEEAFRRQGQAQDAAEKAAKLQDLARAAEELGLDPAHLAEAEEVVRMRAEERERREAARARSVRLGLVAAAGAAVAMVAVAALGWAVLGAGQTPAPPPTVEAAERMPIAADTWALDKNAATDAQATISPGSASLTVTAFAAEADGKYWANLETRPDLDWSGAQAVSVTVEGSGTLDKGRLYLENGDERWRSPEFRVGGPATPQRLELRDFEHQLRRDGEWRVVDQAPPTAVRTASFKFGWWVNDVDRAGTVVVRDVTVER